MTFNKEAPEVVLHDYVNPRTGQVSQVPEGVIRALPTTLARPARLRSGSWWTGSYGLRTLAWLKLPAATASIGSSRMLAITSSGDQDIGRSLDAIYRRLGDLTPAMQSIGMEMESRISGRFETRTDPDGQYWAPWAPYTLANYPEKGNKRLLDRYGDMLGRLSHQADASSVRIGFGKAYAAFHDRGTKHMPRRGG